jgi:lipopolysaccharide export system protein LptA
MKRLIRNLSLACACAGALLCGQAAAQIAPGQGDKGPIDITADKLDKYDADHKVIYTGNVEAVQNGARLLCDTLTLYFDPAAPPAGSAPGATPPKPASSTTSTAEDGFGDLRQAVAEGHVFYVTQSQTVRGEHGVYDAEPDTVTMTGNVVVVQGKNVQRGDKMIMELKTSHTQVFSDATGRNKPGRVRGVFYSENQGGEGQSKPAEGSSKPAAGKTSGPAQSAAKPATAAPAKQP